MYALHINSYIMGDIFTTKSMINKTIAIKKTRIKNAITVYILLVTRSGI